MGSEYQALIAHTKKTKRDHHHSKGKPYHSRRDWATVRFTHVMKKVTYPNSILTKGTQRRRRESREVIMLMLQKMMNLPQTETSKKVMKNMF